MSAWSRDAGAIGQFQKLGHAFPAMHAAQSNFPSAQALAMIGGNGRKRGESLGDALSGCLRYP